MSKELVFNIKDIFDIESPESALQQYGAKGYYIAPYQRGYKWAALLPNDAVCVLMKDLFDAYENAASEYYLQFITTKLSDSNGVTVLEVVDGQQRLTTLTILLSVLSSIMDIWDKEKRSEVMSKIRSRNTKPEVKLRKKLFSKGFRYRINYKKLPGKPDIVLPKYKTVILVNGCFWHGHNGCKYYYTPKTNTEFWVTKINSNKERDTTNINALTALGWNIIIVRECMIAYTKDISTVVEQVNTFLLKTSNSTDPQILVIE